MISTQVTALRTRLGLEALSGERRALVEARLDDLYESRGGDRAWAEAAEGERPALVEAFEAAARGGLERLHQRGALALGRLRPRPIAAAALVEVVEPRLDEGAPLAGEGLEPEPRPQRRHLCGNQISDAPPIDATLSP